MLEVGGWLWEVTLVVLLVAAVPGARMATAIRAARRARRRRAELGPPTAPVGFVDGAPAVLEGCIETRGPTVARHGDDRPVAASSVSVDDAGEARVLAHEQATGLSIAGGGARVELAGRLDVQSGTRERHPGLSARWVRRRLRRRLPEGSDEVQGAIVVRSLASADRVRIAGRLRRVSAAEDVALYREAAARWRLVPAHEGGTLPVVTSGRPRIAGPSLAVLARRTLAALAACALVFLGGGEVAYRIGWLEAATLAPLRRDAALHRLFDREVRAARRGQGTAALERLVLSPSSSSRCGEAVDVVESLGLTERAARLGERCGTEQGLLRAARAWAVLGQWDRAAAAFGRLPPRLDWAALQADILAAAHGRAALAVDAGVPDGTRACLWVALRARSSDARQREEALQELRRAAAGPVPELRFTCGVLLADATPGAARRRILEGLPAAVPGTPWAEIARLLTWEADATRQAPSSEVPLAIDATPSSLAYVWGPSLHVAPGLEAIVLDRLGERRDPPALALRARLATARATLEAIAGNTTEAGRWLDDARRALADLPPEARPPDAAAASRNLPALAAAIALRGADVAGARAWAAEAPWQRPNLENAIQELDLANGSLGAAPTADRSLERIFVRQAGRLMNARASGNAAATAELTAIVARHRAALLTRDSAVLLAAASLPPPAILTPAGVDAALVGLAGAAASATNPVVHRMLQIYALHGTPEAPLFPIGLLRSGTASRFPFRIAAGECRTYVAVGGPGLSDVDVVVTMPDGTVVTDGTFEDLAIARACSATTGEVRVEIRAATGSGAVALQSFAAAPRPGG